MLHTHRLYLRPFALSDLKDFATLCADEDVMLYVGDGTRSIEQVHQQLEQWIKFYNKHHWGLYAVIHKSDDKLIGMCGLYPLELENNAYVELAYRLDKAYWHQGLATEAAAAVIANAFDHLHLDQLVAIAHVDNMASVHVLEKLGMRRVKRMRYHNFPVYLYILSVK